MFQIKATSVSLLVSEATRMLRGEDLGTSLLSGSPMEEPRGPAQ